MISNIFQGISVSQMAGYLCRFRLAAFSPLKNIQDKPGLLTNAESSRAQADQE